MSGDPMSVWVFGKVEPGWYMAAWVWNDQYAKRIESLGYRVMRSQGKPTDKEAHVAV